MAGQAPSDLVPCGAPLSPLPPCGELQKTPARTVAVIDGTLLTVTDLDETLRLKVEHLDEAVAEAGRSALQAEIDSVLLESEAARLRVASRDFYDAEVTRKVLAPTDAEVKAEYEGHRDLYGSRPLEELKVWLAALLAGEREASRVAELARTLRSRFPVVLKDVKDPRGPGVQPGTVLATVGPRSITRASAATRLDAAAFAVAQAVWEEESKAVRQLVRDHLVKSEAAKRGVTPDALVRTEIDERMTPPTDDEIASQYQKYLPFYGNSLSAAKPKVVESLKKERRAALEKEFDKKLSAGRQVRIAVEEPPRPVLTFDTGRSPSRGNPRAAVTLVEMGDFQCPPCRLMWGMMAEALKPYGDRVRYVFRQTPLGMHEFALEAAEASLAAHEQGRFWEYADLLFQNQYALDVASLERYAAQAGLDVERFTRDLESGRFRAEVLEEKRAAARCGVMGTPRFFVNGVSLYPASYTVEGIRAVLDNALREAPAATALRPSAPAP
jgi:protein-disulfide isomerase